MVKPKIEMNSNSEEDDPFVIKLEPESPENSNEGNTQFIQCEYFADTVLGTNENENSDRRNTSDSESLASGSGDYINKKKLSKPAMKRLKRKNSDPDYEATYESDSTDPSSVNFSIVNSRVKLKHFKKTNIQPACIFKDCKTKNVAPIPNIVRTKLLHEYKLYIPRLNKVCLKHLREQNWEELLACTYNDFSATDIADIMHLLKQASQVFINFEDIENIPTRLIRYWMNVNKVQFKRIFDSFPPLKNLRSPKTSLAVFLMYLQNDDVERIALLLKTSEAAIKSSILSVQAIVPCKSYDELNEMFKLEY